MDMNFMNAFFQQTVVKSGVVLGVAGMGLLCVCTAVLCAAMCGCVGCPDTETEITTVRPSRPRRSRRPSKNIPARVQPVAVQPARISCLYHF